MKYLIFILALIISLSGCNQKISEDNTAYTEVPVPEEILTEESAEKSIFAANGTFLTDRNGDFPDDKVFQPVPETGGSLYLYSEKYGDFITKNSGNICSADLYYKNPAGKVYFLANLPVYDDQDPRIPFVHITESIFSLCTPEKIMFFDLESNMQIDFALDFQKTDHRFHGFNCVTYDEKSETYLLIFSVSDYRHNTDEDYAPFHMIWHDESAKLCFQRFASDGSYIDTTETDIPLNFWNTLSPCCPNNYTGTTIEFFRKAGDYRLDDSYYHYDFETGELISRPARDLFIANNFIVSRSDWNYIEGSGIYETSYSVLEHGAETSVLKITSPLDFQIQEANYYYNFPDSVLINPEEKTLEIRYGRAMQSLDFKNEHAEQHYDYSGLASEHAFAKSPDGRYELYSIGNAGRGDELVYVAAKDTRTGNFSYLGEFCFWSYTQAVSDEHRLFFRSYSGIEYLDIENKNCGILIDFETVGENFLCEAYDIENEIIIVASIRDLYDEPDFDISAETINIQLYDFDGNLIKTIKTDIIPWYSGKAYGAYLNDMFINPDGTLTFYDFYGIKDSSGSVIENHEPVTVKYFE